jgi:basic amino acid/polyamine antiporter, APA family
MSADGLLPKALRSVHPRFNTPYVAILVEGAIALALSLLTEVTQLISFAVFNLGVCYLLVCLALSKLRKNGEKGLPGEGILPWIGAAISLYLLYSTSFPDKLIGLTFVLLGIRAYLYFSRTTSREIRGRLVTEEALLEAELDKQYRFLANFVRLARALYKRLAHGRTK